jgi:hypothetical protein
MKDFSYLDKIQISFIIGPARSGTTLLALLLHNHPNCISAPEKKHFLYFYDKYKNLSVVSQSLIDDLTNYFVGNGIDTKNILFNIEDNFFENTLHVGDKINYAQLTKLIYLSFYKNVKDINEVTCIIDKNPYYTFQTDKILHTFPDAKFICINRDYRANILSNRQSQKPYNSVKSVGYYAVIWNYYSEKLKQLLSSLPVTTFLLKYEDLVENKEKEVERIFKFLNIPFSEKVFDYHKDLLEKLSKLNLTLNVYERAVKKISDLSRPINTKRAYAWKNELKETEIKQAEFVCGQQGLYFNYQPISKISVLEKWKFFILTIPGYLRVGLFFLINSPKIHLYLNDVRNANYKKKNSHIPS